MPLRVGIVGCGMIAGGPVRDGRPIAGNLAAACRAVRGVELVAAADVDAPRRAAFGTRWGVTSLFGSASEMLAASSLDIVIVATSQEGHEAACMAALESGVRGIFCEKPFTGSADGARRVVEAARVRGSVLVANFSRRWDGAHRDLAARIARGELGEVREVFASYTGTMRGNGSHFVDTLRMLVPGDWRAAWTSALPPDSVDGPIDAVLEHADGARAHVAAIRGAEYFVFDAQVLGTKGRARLLFAGGTTDVRVDLPAELAGYPGYRYLAETTPLPPTTLAVAFERALEALAAAVRGEAPVDVPPETYVTSLELVDSIVSSATSAPSAENKR